MIQYASKDALAVELAQGIGASLTEAIGARGRALLALSGGSTPKRMFEALAAVELDWSKVTVVPVDERWVSEDHERSNAKLIRDHLLKDRARAAGFVSIHAPTEAPETGMEEVAARLRALPLPFDVLTLGMGTDGHTASFFPGGDNLARATMRDTPELVVPMRAPGADEPRVTLTLPLILDARRIVLHIEGAEKRAVFEVAQAGGDVDEMPVRAVLGAAHLETVWAP